ncbi:MAG TPA: hypothetical protein PKC30_03765 [Saprospiraceae bacterium]|nr:hypothetical protein [Saprospiraceae bacterium]
MDSKSNKYLPEEHFELDLRNIQLRLDNYHKTLENTKSFRKEWHDQIKKMIVDTLQHIISKTSLKATVSVKENIENMEAVVLDLGKVHSGLSEKISQDTDLKKKIVKTQGGLIYQQLFNGKIMIMIIYPYIEGYGDPKPPLNVEILRPDELKQAYILRHVEDMLKEITIWEDFDDEPRSKTSIGFASPVIMKENDKND